MPERQAVLSFPSRVLCKFAFSLSQDWELPIKREVSEQHLLPSFLSQPGAGSEGADGAIFRRASPHCVEVGSAGAAWLLCPRFSRGCFPLTFRGAAH